MDQSIPESFTFFLKAILEAQSYTDQWRAKVFYKPPQQILKLLKSKPYAQKNSEDKITLETILKFYQSKDSNSSLSQQEQKVFMKYFSFQSKCTQQTDQFINRLKPINNKLITNIQKHQNTQQCLHKLLQSILFGFQNIKKARLKCNQDIDKIIKFFDIKLHSKWLSKDSLKEYLFETDLYNRVNFNYLKDYIFGEKQEKIDWNTIFKKTIVVTDQINEVQQEQFVSQEKISTMKKIKQNDTKHPQFCQFQPSLILQTVSDIQSMTQANSGKNIPPNLQSKVSDSALKQISRIEVMLNQTKQKYLKNKQELQNSKKQLKQKSFKKKQQSSQKTMKHLIQQIGSSKIVQQQKQNHKQQRHKQNKGTLIDMIYEQSPHSKQNNSKNPDNMDQSIVKVFSSKQSLGLFQTHKTENKLCSKIQSNFSLNVKTDRREVGKIKKRSISKDKQSQNINAGQKQRSNSIKKEQPLNNKYPNSYNRLYQPNLQPKSRLSLSNQNFELNSQIKLYRPLTRLNLIKDQTQNEAKKQDQFSTRHSFQQSRRQSQNRLSQIMKQIDDNVYPSRGRISSKKKQEIVQMATNQARLRIQQIQRKALNRMAKIDSQLEDNFKTAQIKRRVNNSVNYAQNSSLNKDFNKDKSSFKHQLNKQNSKSRLIGSMVNRQQNQSINYQKPYSTTLQLTSSNSLKNRYV